MSPQELKELLKLARTHNRKTGITGFLMYQDMRFIQLIEGPDRSVYRLWENIRRDTRHTRITLNFLQKIDHRLFLDWSMGFANLAGMSSRQPDVEQASLSHQNLPHLLREENVDRTLEFISSFRNKLNKDGNYSTSVLN